MILHNLGFEYPSALCSKTRSPMLRIGSTYAKCFDVRTRCGHYRGQQKGLYADIQAYPALLSPLAVPNRNLPCQGALTRNSLVTTECAISLFSANEKCEDVSLILCSHRSPRWKQGCFIQACPALLSQLAVPNRKSATNEEVRRRDNGPVKTLPQSWA